MIIMILTRLLTPNPNESTRGQSAEYFRTIVNIADALGFTPLMKAAHGGHTDCLSVLLQHKADPDFVAKDNSTALHLAAQQGFSSAVEILLEYGADYNPIAHLEKLFALGTGAIPTLRLAPNCSRSTKTFSIWVALARSVQRHAVVTSRRSNNC